jgi:hypothetical protein
MFSSMSLRPGVTSRLSPSAAARVAKSIEKHAERVSITNHSYLKLLSQPLAAMKVIVVILSHASRNCLLSMTVSLVSRQVLGQQVFVVVAALLEACDCEFIHYFGDTLKGESPSPK